MKRPSKDRKESPQPADHDSNAPGGDADFRPSELGGAERDAIARRAHERFEQRGREHGHDQEDWFEAERLEREERERAERIGGFTPGNKA